MRRVRNVLPSCHATYGLAGEKKVYNRTGNPLQHRYIPIRCRLTPGANGKIQLTVVLGTFETAVTVIFVPL